MNRGWRVYIVHWDITSTGVAINLKFNRDIEPHRIKILTVYVYGNSPASDRVSGMVSSWAVTVGWAEVDDSVSAAGGGPSKATSNLRCRRFSLGKYS